MSKNQARVGIGIDFNVNQQSLNQIKNSLKELKNMSKADIEKSGGGILGLSDSKTKSWKNDLGAMRKELGALEKAFEAAYNPKLGTYELSKFNAALKESGTSAQRAFEAVGSYGSEGQAALLNMTTGLLATDRAAKQVHSTFQKLGDTMMNTIRWSVTSTAINTVTGAIQKAYSYALDLDKSLNDIMIVTDKSAGDMEKFARQANKAAKALGSTTTEYTEASLIYYQQGLSEKEVAARTDTTLKTAAITGQSAEAVSQQLTAVWNGYKVSANEAEKYIDKLSAVAATTGADLEELSTGMSRVASAANIMGVDVDQLNAQLATIVTVTREAPETIGTALKTVYARMSDIEAGLDTETTLGEYTSQMAAMGINVLDANGKLRDMGAVVEEIGNKWSSLNREQQVSLAQSIAGTRQYSRMMALFDNWDMYQESLTTSINSLGTLNKQHTEYLESIEAHQNKLTASTESLYDSIFNSDEIKGVYDMLSGIVTLIDELVQSMGGMPGILATVGMLFAKAARNSIADLISKREANKLNAELYKKQIQEGQAFIEQQKAEIKGNTELEKHLQKVLDLEKQIYTNADNLTDEQWKNLQAGVNAYNDSVQKTIQLEKERKQLESETKEYWHSQPDAITRNRRGAAKDTSVFIHGKEQKFRLTSQEGIDELIVARKKLANEQKKLDQKSPKAKELQNEIKQIDKTIGLAKKENQIYQEQKDSLKKKNEEIEQSVQITEDLGNVVQDSLDKDISASKITSILEGLTSIAFTATTASSSITNFVEQIRDGEMSMEGFIGSIGSLSMSILPLITQFGSVKAGLHGVSTGAITGAAAWQAYWAAATWGLSLIITALTTIGSLIASNIEKQKQARKDAIEDANAAIEEAKANRDLADSYLELYDAYEKSGEITEDLKTTAEKLIETYGLQGYAIDMLCGDYDALAEAAKKAREEETKTIRENQQTQFDINKEQILEDVRGSSYVTKNSDSFSINNLSNRSYNTEAEQNVKALDLIENAIQGIGTIDRDSDYEVSIKLNNDDTGTLIAFYNALQNVYDDLPESNVKDDIEAILKEKESFADHFSSYKESAKSIQTERFKNFISSKKYNKGTSSQEFRVERDAFIKDTIAQGFSEEEARNLVDQIYAEAGGTAKQMMLREQFLEKLQRDGISDEDQINKIREAYNSLGEQEFAALITLDLEEFNKDIEHIVNESRKKAQEIQDSYWASFSEDRIEALTNSLEELEKQEEKTFGEKRLKLIQEQSKNLQQQYNILKATVEIRKTEFQQERTQTLTDLAEEWGLGNNAWLDQFKGLIENQDYEGARTQISRLVTETGNADLDAQNAFLTFLGQTIGKANELEEISQNLKEVEEAHGELRMEAIEAIHSQYETEIEYITSINELLEKQSSLYELIYGDSKWTERAGIMESMLEYTKEAEIAAKEQYLIARAAYEQATDENEKKELASQMAQYAGAYMDAVNATVEQAQEAYAATTKAAFESFERELGGKSMNVIKEEWDWTQARNSDYLDAIQRGYGMEKIRSAFQKSAENTSIKNLQKINDLRDEELAALKEKDKLSQQDLDRAQARLEVLEAQIALEEAQQNKTKMQLVRGADGAYSYEYIADQNAIDEAKDNLTAANESLYNLDVQAYEDSLNKFYDLYAEWRDKVTELAEQGYSETEIQEKLQPYTIELTRMADESAAYRQNLLDSTRIAQEQLGLDATKITSNLNSSLGKFVDTFGEDGAQSVIADLTSSAAKAYTDYADTIKDKAEEINKVLNGDGKDDFGVNGALASQYNTITQLAPKVDTLAAAYERVATAWATVPEDIKTGGSDAGGETAGEGVVTNPNDGSNNGIGTIINEAGLIVTTEKHGEQGIHIEARSDGDGARGGSFFVYSEDGERKTVADEKKLRDANDKVQELTIADNILYQDLDGEYYYKTHVADDEDWIRYIPVRHAWARVSGTNHWANTKIAFDTGGYTGEWNSSEGRMAMLHEKELVLNKDDTSNFLKAIDILRSLNMSMLDRIAGLTNFYNNASSSSWTSENSNIVQTIEMYIDFPNATDRTEIEEALKSLPSYATQHAYKSTKT